MSKTKKIRALLILPDRRGLVEVDLAQHRHADLLGCAHFTVVRLDSRTVLYLDDEGRLSYPNPLGYFVLGGEIFCGRGLIVGSNEEGDDVSCDAPIEAALDAISILTSTPPEDLVAPCMTCVFDADNIADDLEAN